jgi:hypothetical protein
MGSELLLRNDPSIEYYPSSKTAYRRLYPSSAAEELSKTVGEARTKARWNQTSKVREVSEEPESKPTAHKYYSRASEYQEYRPRPIPEYVRIC